MHDVKRIRRGSQPHQKLCLRPAVDHLQNHIDQDDCPPAILLINYDSDSPWIDNNQRVSAMLVGWQDLHSTCDNSLDVFLRVQPKNLWALKNLGACLLKQSKAAEAVPVFEAALKANPDDVQSLLGLGQAFEETDRVEDADDQYVKLIHIGGPDHILDLAKARRTALAQKTMRDRGSFRPDVMMYITGALDKFAGMTKSQIQAIGFEIAILGQRGLDINDPDQKYSLRTLPGEFSGLHLCSIMYAAFKQFAPNEDVGIDFSKEYEVASGSRSG